MEFMKKCLHDGGYADLIKTFIEEEIDDIQFSQLQYETLRDIFLKSGPRQAFWLKYKMEMAIPCQSPSVASLSTVSDVSSLCTISGQPLSLQLISTNQESISDVTLENNIEEILTSSFLSDNSQSKPLNTVREYLKCANGSIVSNFYNKNKKLSQRERNLLANVVVQKEFEACSDNFKITTERFKHLSKEIVELFCTETEEIYYTPYQPKPRALASGKLWECYNRLKKNLRKSLPPVSEEKPDTLEEFTEELSNKVLFLKNNLEPFEKIQSYWKDTFTYRRNLLTSPDSNVTINSYLNAFSALRGPKGYYLLGYDFDSLYPESSDRLFSNWPTINQKLIEKAKADFPKDYKNSSVCNDITGFLLLPRFLGSCTYGKSKQGSKRIKFTKELMSFLFHVKDANLVTEKLEEVRSHLRTLKQTLQPTVIVVGEQIDNCSKSYVAIDDALYFVDGPLVAIDLCFKSFNALHAKFPEPSEAIWTFIQQRAYGIKTEYDRHSVVVSSLISDTI